MDLILFGLLVPMTSLGLIGRQTAKIRGDILDVPLSGIAMNAHCCRGAQAPPPPFIWG